MKMIPLYDVKPLSPPSSITLRHWQSEAELAEWVLRQFLSLDVDADVLLLDRATHGLELAMNRTYSGHDFIIPCRTYRAAWDAVTSYPRRLSSHSQMRPGSLSVVVSTTLGGTRPVWLGSTYPFVYDCAHTCYKNMLKGVVFGDEQFLVLSFYPTKPLGAYGGGALIGSHRTIKQLRPQAWPLDDTSCRFYYPQSVQSWGIRQRAAEWDEEHWSTRRRLWADIADWIFDRYDLEFAWPQPVGAVMETPHLLALRGPDVGRLRQDCAIQRIETGNHYPPLDGSDGPKHVTVPFHTVEVIDRLQKHGRRQSNAGTIRNTCPR